jgi:outer membrane protein TolC
LFQVKCQLLDLYLQAQYYRQIVRQAAASIERNRIEKEAVGVLVRNGLKAGIDSAELNTTLMRSVIDSMQVYQKYLATLTELKWMTGITLPADRILLTDSVFTMTQQRIPDTGFTGKHPYFQLLRAKRNSSSAALAQVSHSWVPQLDIWSNLYSRGSGIDAGGQVHTWDGLGLSRTNAGIGLQLSFPILQFSRVNIQKKQYHFMLRSDEAQLAQARLDLGKQTEDALTAYTQNLKIAGNIDQLVISARNVYEGAKISYATGLSDYVRLSTAETALYQSEISRVNARIQVWRTLLSLASAEGDLSIFTDQLP